MKVSKSASRETAMRKAIGRLNDCLLDTGKRPVLFMLSGGSAFELLAGVNMKHIGRHVTLAVLDERYSKDPAINNFAQLCETDFYKKAERKGADYIDTRVHRGITHQGLARKFERGLKRWKKKHPKGTVVITQGMGEDSHTAGIMAYARDPKKFEKLFENEKKWVVGYSAPRGKTEYPRRITVTLPFLRKQVGCAVVYAAGTRKRRALLRVLAEKGNLAKTPARIFREMKNTHLFTDQNVFQQHAKIDLLTFKVNKSNKS